MEEILVPIAVCVVLPIVIVWLVSRVRQNETNRKADIMLKAIENGQQVDPAFFKPSKSPAQERTIKMDLLEKLNAACITTFMGVAFIIYSIVCYFIPDGLDNFFLSNMAPIAGGVLLAVGIALFVTYFTGKKMLAKEIEAEENAPKA